VGCVDGRGALRLALSGRLYRFDGCCDGPAPPGRAPPPAGSCDGCPTRAGARGELRGPGARTCARRGLRGRTAHRTTSRRRRRGTVTRRVARRGTMPRRRVARPVVRRRNRPVADGSVVARVASEIEADAHVRRAEGHAHAPPRPRVPPDVDAPGDGRRVVDGRRDVGRVDIAGPVHDAPMVRVHADVARQVADDDVVRRRLVHVDVLHVAHGRARGDAVEPGRPRVRDRPRPLRGRADVPDRLVTDPVLAVDQQHRERSVHAVRQLRPLDGLELRLAVPGDDQVLAGVALHLGGGGHLRVCDRVLRLRRAGDEGEHVARVGLRGNVGEVLRQLVVGHRRPRAVERLRGEPAASEQHVHLLRSELEEDVAVGVGRGKQAHAGHR